MSRLEVQNIEMLSKKPKDAVFEQLESDIHHTPYEAEAAFYTCIENGDEEGVEAIMESFMKQSVVVGRMSNNDLKQMQYFAVCCIALATRSAIRGGLSEITAFNLSDEYIQIVDSITRAEDMPLFLSGKAVELTGLVRQSAGRREYPEALRRAVYYIESHLYQKISPAQVAEFSGLSKDYLNVVFKKHTGKTTGAYISGAKLFESKRLLSRGFSLSEIAYQLAFCSESYFVACYKKEFGVTPKGSRSSREKCVC